MTVKREHWFLSEIFKWRTIASAVWTWCISFPVLAVFTALLLLHPSRHIFVIYDFVNILSCLTTWITCTILATLTSLLIQLHYRYYEVVPVYPVNRHRLIARSLNPYNLAYYASTGLYCTVVTHFCSHLVHGRYSHTYHRCSLGNGSEAEFCINEAWFIMVLFGWVVGIVHSGTTIMKHRNALHYLGVQEARFLYIKCKLPSIILEVATKSFNIARKFFIVYYFLGFALRDAAAFVMGVLPSENHLLSIWRIVCALSTFWNLWLFGMLLLTFLELSWQLFNVYNTQNFPFLFDSVFPEDQPKLLVENLTEENPPAVQYLAHQCLALIAKENPVRRQHVFALSHQTENGRPVWWNKIADNCLSRLREFTDQLGEYHLKLSASTDAKLNRSKASSTSSTGSNDSKSDMTIGSVSTLHRRPMATLDATYADATNLSYLNVSSLNATATHSLNATHTSTKATVPTPRLWTKRNDATLSGDGTLENTFGDLTVPMQIKTHSKRFQNFVNNIKSLPFVSYFIKTIPQWSLLNLYSKRLLYIWAMQSLSYICAASVTEDKYGAVQTRLHEVVSTLVDLLQALEKLGKPSASAYLYKVHVGICNETKASLHRIADAFGDSLYSVSMSQEHRRRMQSFVDYCE